MMPSDSRRYAAVFDPSDYYFVIDSNNFGSAKDALYGYCVFDDGVATTVCDLLDRSPNGSGTYVLIRRAEGTITIEQDYLGSFGLYLYRQGGYFALSNSFFYLLEYLVGAHTLSLNQRFVDDLLFENLCSTAMGETAVNEIRMLDRRAQVTIFTEDAKLEITHRSYGENEVYLDTSEGMALLDSWYERWSNLVTALARRGLDLNADLTGGFDSRLVFTLFMRDPSILDGVTVLSKDDQLHTHAEDFKIASEIARRLGFTLNQRKVNQTRYPYSSDDSLLISYYAKLGFCKEMYYKDARNEGLRYHVTGAGGECLREYWSMGQSEYVQRIARAARGVFSTELSERVESSIRSVLDGSFDELRRVQKLVGRIDPESNLMADYYRDTRCRNHFGRACVEAMAANILTLTPLMDADLHRLRLTTGDCDDRNLLAAVIFERYAPQLVDVSFEGGRAIRQQTYAYAHELCERFPLRIGSARDCAVSWSASEACDQLAMKLREVEELPKPGAREMLLDAFESDGTRKIAYGLGEDEMYDYVRYGVGNTKFYPPKNVTAVMAEYAVSWVLANPSDENGFCAFVSACAASRKQDRLLSRPSIFSSVPPELLPYTTLRVDVSLPGHADALDCKAYGERLSISRPPCLNTSGSGFVISAPYAPLRLELMNTGEEGGEVLITLRGIDCRVKDRGRIPCWVTLTSVNLGAEECVSSKQPVSYDKTYVMRHVLEPGERIVVNAEWRPYSITQDAPLVGYPLHACTLPGGTAEDLKQLKEQAAQKDKRIRQLTAELDKVRKRNSRLAGELEAARASQKRADDARKRAAKKLEDLKGSKSYRFGRLAGAPVRTLRKFMGK